MLSDDHNPLPFQNNEIEDLYSDAPTSYKRKQKRKKPKRDKQQQIVQPFTRIKNDDNNLAKIYYIYFERNQDENDLLSFVTYTGPSNTIHLNKQLYLPQLKSTIRDDSVDTRQRFVNDYNQTCSTITTSADTSFAVFIRFEMMYLVKTGLNLQQSVTVKDFINPKNRGLFSFFFI